MTNEWTNEQLLLRIRRLEEIVVKLEKAYTVLAGASPHEPCEQLPPELAWGLESKLPGESWKVYWSLYSDRARAEQAAKNGRPEGTEWRVVTYARMPEGASRDASGANETPVTSGSISAGKSAESKETGVATCGVCGETLVDGHHVDNDPPTAF